MKELEKMTRKELATLIVEDQIKRGIVKEENKEVVIKGHLKGCGCCKPDSWLDLYEYVKRYL